MHNTSDTQEIIIRSLIEISRIIGSLQAEIDPVTGEITGNIQTGNLDYLSNLMVELSTVEPATPAPPTSAPDADLMLLYELYKATQEMRELQRGYFRSRSGELLGKAKGAESKVDQLLNQIATRTQPMQGNILEFSKGQ